MLRRVSSCVPHFCCLLTIATIVASTPALADEQWPLRFVDRDIVLRPSVNACRNLYYDVGDHSYQMYLRGEMFPLFGRETITVYDHSISPNSVSLHYSTEYLGNGSIEFSGESPEDRLGYEIVLAGLNIIDAQSDAPVFRVKQGSDVIHYIGSNHCSASEPGATYASLDSAMAQGFRPCTACFEAIDAVPDLEAELEIGRAMSADIRGRFPVVQDGATQKRMKAIGNTVLGNWPWPLRGFDYTFTAIVSPITEIFACAGGEVFVSDQLIDLCDGPIEIEIMIARAIAHVELRHAIRQFTRAKDNAAIASLLAGVLGALASDNVEFGAMVGTSSMIAAAALDAEHLLGHGYIDRFEDEADAVACMYLEQNYIDGGRSAFLELLDKFSYLLNCRSRNTPETVSRTHEAKAKARLDFVRNAQIRVFSPPKHFGFTLDDVSAGEFFVNGIIKHNWYDDSLGSPDGDPERSPLAYCSDLRLFGTVIPISAIGLNSELKDGAIWIDGHKYDLDCKEDTRLVSHRPVLISLVRQKRSGSEYEDIPTLDIDNVRIRVKHMKVVEDDW